MKDTILMLVALLLGPLAILHAADSLLVEKTEGPVTAREIRAFKDFMRSEPVPTNNLHNAMVYGNGGMSADALGRLYETSGDQELLDRMIAFTDAMLAVRNDPKTGVVIWTGQRELIWPNAVMEKGKPASFATENGDVVGHIANAARLILQHEKLWQVIVPDGDPNGFGATYRERAVRYVREMDRTMDSFIFKWMVRPDTLRYYSPNSPLYDAVCVAGHTGNQPVPWNQQTMLNNGFQRLAECHRLLGDNAARVKQYDAIVKTSVDWFFNSVERVTVKGHDCYRWAYSPEEPIKHVEDLGHGSYDIKGLYRSYQSGRYGITIAMMEPFANAVLYVLRQPDGKFSRRVDGSRNPCDRAPGGLNAPYLDLSEFAPELFPLFCEVNKVRINASPELAAAVLCNKQRRSILPRNPAAN
jgi:hypothetical protein